MIGFAHAKLIEENIRQRWIVILSGVYYDVTFGQAVKLLDDTAEANDFRPRAEDGHYLHASMSSSYTNRSPTIRLCLRSSSATSPQLITLSTELYSFPIGSPSSLAEITSGNMG